mmetsp:Transcript_9099/g.37232  ORF Transcript_9099/g.37232 Transcript_9099/m.37232 type:complete len:522 (-) Transcript_9099:182-1747(-)
MAQHELGVLGAILARDVDIAATWLQLLLHLRTEDRATHREVEAEHLRVLHFHHLLERVVDRLIHKLKVPLHDRPREQMLIIGQHEVRCHQLPVEERLAQQTSGKVEVRRRVFVRHLRRRVDLVREVVHRSVLPQPHVDVEQLFRHQLEPLARNAARVLRGLARELKAEDAAHVVGSEPRKARERVLQEVRATNGAADVAGLPHDAQAAEHATEPTHLLIERQRRGVLEVSRGDIDRREARVHGEVLRVHEGEREVRLDHAHEPAPADAADGDVLQALQQVPLFEYARVLDVHAHRLKACLELSHRELTELRRRRRQRPHEIFLLDAVAPRLDLQQRQPVLQLLHGQLVERRLKVDSGLGLGLVVFLVLAHCRLVVLRKHAHPAQPVVRRPDAAHPALVVRRTAVPLKRLAVVASPARLGPGHGQDSVAVEALEPRRIRRYHEKCLAARAHNRPVRRRLLHLGRWPARHARVAVHHVLRAPAAPGDAVVCVRRGLRSVRSGWALLRGVLLMLERRRTRRRRP